MFLQDFGKKLERCIKNRYCREKKELKNELTVAVDIHDAYRYSKIPMDEQRKRKYSKH